MKTKILFCTLFVCLSIFAQSDFDLLKQQYEQAEEQYREIYTKNRTEIENLKVKQSQLTEVLSQKEEEIKTAKSLKAKKLNKQIDNLVAEVSQLEFQIKEYEREIEKATAIKDSLQLEIHKQQESVSEEITPIEKVYDPESVVLSEEPELECLDKVREENNASPKSIEDDDPIGTILFVIGLFVLFVIIARIKTERCPYCKKKGTLKSLGDTRKYQYDEKGNVTRTGVLKRYKCKHCGNYVEKLKWS